MNAVKKPVLGMVAVLVMAAGLTIVPIGSAEAHPWRCSGSQAYHWLYSGNGDLNVTTEYKNLQFKRQAKRAAKNLLSVVPFVKLPTGGGAQMTVVDSNEGDKGFAGLATVKPDASCHIQHADVLFNTFYASAPSFTQGVFCQEIGHAFGLDHSDDGSCMGLGYFRNGTTKFSSHNGSDLRDMYGHSHNARAPSDERLAHADPPPMLIYAAWGFSPDSLGEAEAEAETVVTAQAVSSQPGAPIVTEDGISIPTTTTQLEVDTAYKGDALPGETVAVTQLGGGGVFTTEDPEYRPGQEYLLMLEPDEGNLNHIVSPDSRYAVRADGTLSPTMATSVSSAVAGQSLNALTGSLGLQPIRAGKREFGGEGLTRILVIVGIVLAALIALVVIARFALGRR